MNPKSTDEAELRREIGRVLAGPAPYIHTVEWDREHDPPWYCIKCNACVVPSEDGQRRVKGGGCPIPDPFEGPLEVAAELLLRKVLEREEGNMDLVSAVWGVQGHDETNTWEYFARMLPADRCRVLLKALEGGKDG